MLPKGWKKEIEQAVEKAYARNAEREKTQVASQNAIAAPLDRLDKKFGSYKDEQSAAEKGKRCREIATICGLYLNAFLVFITAGIFYCQLRESQRLTLASRDQLSLTFPPKILVKQLIVFAKDGDIRIAPKMEPGQEISGFAYAGDVGREPTNIKEAICVTYWGTEPLPMQRPYDHPIAATAKACDHLKMLDGSIASQLSPDITHTWAKWQFDTAVPKNYKEGTFLFVMGHIEYTDRLNTWRVVRFARRYDPGERRFIAVNNPDYEGYDE